MKDKNESRDVLQFEDLFDLDEIQKIQDSFSLATGMASIIVKPDGTPITKSSGFCALCNTIRQTEIGSGNCMISDAAIGKMVKDGPTIQRCLSGHLLDAGASIIVDDQHVGSWLVGQVILEGDSEDKMFEYADKVGISRETYQKLLSNVKRISYEQFENMGRFLYINAKYLSEIAHQKLTLTKEVELRIEREKEIIYLGNHDFLTRLYNRRFFEEELLRLDTSRNLPMSIIMGDVNGLKLINDSFGHEAGDELLKVSANAIKNACRDDEIIARFGGDEFAIILPKSSAAQVEGVIDRIKFSLLNLKISGIDVSIAFGFGTKNLIEQDILLTVKEAEDYMYRNKLFESSSMHFKTIELISKVLFEKNGRELLHSERVSKLCELLALKLGFDKEHIAFLKTTGLMHDIGKIAIEDNILNKIGKLSVDEYKEIKKHPEIGYRILCSVSEFSELAIHVLQHHEKWDGSGYPKGLKGEEISVDARIVALADTYDAITSYRTYRDILTKDEAIEEIKRCLGTQFDPRLGNEFIELLSENTDI